MPVQLAASQNETAVLLRVAGQPERSKYAAHCRQLPGRLVLTKSVCDRCDTV